MEKSIYRHCEKCEVDYTTHLGHQCPEEKTNPGIHCDYCNSEIEELKTQHKIHYMNIGGVMEAKCNECKRDAEGYFINCEDCHQRIKAKIEEANAEIERLKSYIEKAALASTEVIEAQQALDGNNPTFGSAQGQIEMAPDFDKPMVLTEDDIDTDDFNGGNGKGPR